jgi:hypothetical protein
MVTDSWHTIAKIIEITKKNHDSRFYQQFSYKSMMIFKSFSGGSFFISKMIQGDWVNSKFD